MARLVKRLLHLVVARPSAYELAQRAAGAGRVRRTLAGLVAEVGSAGLVLDVGGGTGLYRSLWGPGWAYLCLDNDPEKLRGFAGRARRDAVILGDAAALPIRDGSVDAVLCTAVSHHLSDKDLAAFVRESARVLKPGGALVFLDAVWRPGRYASRILWALDRGAHPRTREQLLAAVGERFRVTTTEALAVFHEYVAVVATPRTPDDPGPPEQARATEAEPGGTYDPAYFERLFAVEDRHFWFRARNRAIVALVRQAVRPGAASRILEVGCGTGVVLAELERALPKATVVGMDLFIEGLRFARRRTGADLVLGDVQAPPFRAVFDVVGVFDVLEHLPNDERVLRALRALLQPDGVLVATVPAHQALWSYFDVASRHQRRYAPAELEEKLKAAGFAVEFLSQFMAPLVVPMWATRRARDVLGRGLRRAATADELAAEDLQTVRGVNEAMGWLLQLETLALARRVRLPIGTSLIAVARVPASTDARP